MTHLARALAEGFAWQGEPSPHRKGEVRGEPSADLPPAAFVPFLQNHDQVGNRALGERIASLADPAALRLVTATLLLSPSVPLLFMGEEFAASTPFLYFCDFAGELADAVREGRRREFSAFARFRDPAARERIPDPGAEETFAASKLKWEERERGVHAEYLAFYARAPRGARAARGPPSRGRALRRALPGHRRGRPRGRLDAGRRRAPAPARELLRAAVRGNDRGAGRPRARGRRGARRGPCPVERHLEPRDGVMESSLARLAGLYGIEPGYHDIWGEWRATPEGTQRRLLAALGVEVDDEASVAAALAAAERARWERVVPAITVLRRAGLDRGMRVQLPESAFARALSWRIAEESGEVREERFDALALVRIEDHASGDFRATAFRLPLPADLPDGYHRIAIVAGPTVLGEGQLAVAPPRCYLPPAIADGARVWGTTVQLYGVRSSRNAGIGDFTDLRHCAEVWGERGAAIVGTNPLHALSLRDPGHASPYSPSSRLFLNPIYLDVEAIDDFAEIAASDPGFTTRWRAQCERLRAPDSVDYAAVAAAKRTILETLYAHFCRRHLEAGSTRARLYAQFRAARGHALRHHALHEALSELHGAPWRQWPEEHRDPSSDAVRRHARENALAVGLHEYLQWQADLQLARAQERCGDLGMAVGPLRRPRDLHRPRRLRGVGQPAPLRARRLRGRAARRVQLARPGLGPAAATIRGVCARPPTRRSSRRCAPTCCARERCASTT